MCDVTALADWHVFFSLSVCLLQQWETFSERSSSSQTLTQFDSNIAPADPVSQSLRMHGFTINGQMLTFSGSLCSLSLSLCFCMMMFLRICCISSQNVFSFWLSAIPQSHSPIMTVFADCDTVITVKLWYIETWIVSQTQYMSYEYAQLVLCVLLQ